MVLSETAEKAVDAYGGRSLWQQAKTLEATISARGLAFILKWRPFFRRSTIVEDVHRPYSRLTPIGREPDMSGVLDGDTVRLEDGHGRVIKERQNARGYFVPGRRLFWWDDLDMTYFANYASWNYFTLPALLMNEEIAWSELRPGLLQARFPESIPTHNRIQQFTFDRQTGLLKQHDYTAEIISPLATAANVVLQHAKNADGMLYPSIRRVTPRSPQGSPMPFPVLIRIDIHDYRIST